MASLKVQIHIAKNACKEPIPKSQTYQKEKANIPFLLLHFKLLSTEAIKLLYPVQRSGYTSTYTLQYEFLFTNNAH